VIFDTVSRDTSVPYTSAKCACTFPVVSPFAVREVTISSTPRRRRWRFRRRSGRRREALVGHLGFQAGLEHPLGEIAEKAPRADQVHALGSGLLDELLGQLPFRRRPRARKTKRCPRRRRCRRVLSHSGCPS